MTIDNETIENLTYPDPDDASNSLNLRRSDKAMLKLWREYVLHREASDNPIGDNWLQVTQADFDAFRISPSNIARLSTASPMAPVNQGHTSASTAPKFSKVDIFRKGIKRDMSLFPTLKDERFNDAWHRSFVAQARAQDVDKVLDGSYIPSTQEEKDLFTEQQKYIYAVLEAKVLTDVGKTFVRAHEHDFDGQAVYNKLKVHHLKSTKAMIDSSAILTYITSARLGNGEWKGSTEGFILHWQDQVRLYERQVPTSDHFSDSQKRTMLENAVQSITELRQVKNNADLEKAKSGIVLTYDQYSSLLLSAAVAHDNQTSSKRTKQQIFTHEYLPHEDATDSFDIETPVSIVQAFASMTNQAKPASYDNKPRMSKEQWYTLSEKERLLWDQFDDRAKAVILGLVQPTPTSKPVIKSGGTNALKGHKVNLHEISAYDFLQTNMHELMTRNLTDDPNLDDHPQVDSETPDTNIDDPNDTVLINAAKSAKPKLSPGDIQRVMSKSSTRSINMARIVYTTSASRISGAKTMSLIDRGANGGLAGDDVRVIFKTNRCVDIRGIDNHQITGIDIGTVGGVVDTHKGPVIAIMHQYALLGKGSSIHAPGQMEHFKNQVYDKSKIVGGKQAIITLDGYMIPLYVKDGLVRLKIRPYTDGEFDDLPHVFLTSESDWDPSVLDSVGDDDSDMWFDSVSDIEPDPNMQRFDEVGDYRHRVTVQHADFFHRRTTNDFEDVIDRCIYHSQVATSPPKFYDAYEVDVNGDADEDEFDPSQFHLKVDPRTVAYKAPDFSLLRPFFGWLSTDVIKKTFEHTTQYARLPSGTLLKRAFRSSNPALNVLRRNESVACDVVYANVPAVDDGARMATIFTGLDTQVTDVYGMKTDRQFVNTLEDNIRSVLQLD